MSGLRFIDVRGMKDEYRRSLIGVHALARRHKIDTSRFSKLTLSVEYGYGSDGGPLPQYGTRC